MSSEQVAHASAAASRCAASRTRRWWPARAVSPTTCRCPGQACVCLQRSPYPHARIVAIDTAAALAMPGVLAVYTGADLVAAGLKPIGSQPMFPAPGGAPAPKTPRHALAVEDVRFVGEAVVAVVAETLDQARAARDAVMVDYEELPNVIHLADATAAGAPKVWADAADNFAAEARHGNAEACDAAFAKAAHVVELELVNQRLAPMPLEPRAVLGSFEDDRVTLRMSSQMPSGVRDTLCNEVFGWPTDKLRVVVGDVGGGFGKKTGAYPEDIVVAFCTHTLQRAGEVGRRAQRGVPRRGPRPRPSSATPSWRWTPTAACWACACARRPTSAPMPRPPAWSSSC